MKAPGAFDDTFVVAVAQFYRMQNRQLIASKFGVGLCTHTPCRNLPVEYKRIIPI